MTKTSITFFVFLFLVSCTMTEKRERQDAEVTDTLLKTTGLPPRDLTLTKKKLEVPEAATTWDAEVYMVNFNQEEEAKVAKAVSIIKKIIATKEFKDRILDYNYQGKKEFFDNEGLSNEKIYQIILNGAEQMGNKASNNIMDVELELYTQTTNTIGYTYPNTVRIWMNKKYFNKYSPIKVADNLMHEWMHKLGFGHAVTWSVDRDHSVPYAIGYLIEELAKKYTPE